MKKPSVNTTVTSTVPVPSQGHATPCMARPCRYSPCRYSPVVMAPSTAVARAIQRASRSPSMAARAEAAKPGSTASTLHTAVAMNTLRKRSGGASRAASARPSASTPITAALQLVMRFITASSRRPPIHWPR